MIALAGKCAEEIEFGEHTQGCSNDLEKATKTIYEMITADGFNEESLLNQNVLMENGLQSGVNDEIIRVCNNKLFEYNEQTMKILNDNKTLLYKLRDKLLNEKVIVMPTLESIEQLH